VRSAGTGLVVCPINLSGTNLADHGPNATDASSTHGHCHGDRYALQVGLDVQLLINVSISNYFSL
jgi:hypothetical protein